INGTSPNPVRNSEFSRTLARAVHRPFIPFGPPDALLELVLGGVAQAITKGQKVLPARAQALGYPFKYPDLAKALQDLLARPPAEAKPRPAPAAAGAQHH